MTILITGLQWWLPDTSAIKWVHSLLLHTLYSLEMSYQVQLTFRLCFCFRYESITRKGLMLNTWSSGSGALKRWLGKAGTVIGGLIHRGSHSWMNSRREGRLRGSLSVKETLLSPGPSFSAPSLLSMKWATFSPMPFSQDRSQITVDHMI